VTEHDIGRVLPAISLNDSVGKGKKLNCKQIEKKDMKAKNQILKGLAMILLFFAGTLGVIAQTSTTPTQSVCPGTEPYKIIPDNAANTFLWSITPGTSGVEWTISAPTAAVTDIVWANPATPQVYTVTFKELAATGCFDEVTLVVTVNPRPILTVINPGPVCFPATVDLTAAAVTTGSTLPTGTVLTYWTDAGATTALATPAAVTTSGTYYIKAETAAGCSDTKPVTVTVNSTPVLAITNPAPVCSPTTVDLTAAAVTVGSTLPTGTVLTYWTDATATTTLATPAAVATSGTYYIKAETAAGCNDIKPVAVVVNPTPILVVVNPGPVCFPATVDLTAAAVTTGSTLPTGTVLTYWTDAAATATLATPAAVIASGTYYIKAETAAGCSDIKPAVVTVNPAPVLSITFPIPVCSPTTVDLTAALVTSGSTLPSGTVLTYWTDAAATAALATPAAVTTSGTYYIKAESAAGCKDIKAVVVVVNPTPALAITNPAPVCSPTTVDLTAAAVTAGSTLPTGTVLTYWTDAAATATLATPAAVIASGTYYIKAETAAGCSDIKPVTVTVNPVPVLAITNPAPVCSPTTVDLTAAAVTAGSTLPTGTVLTYWIDAAATTALATPATVATSGTYYIKAESAAGCIDIKSVVVVVNPTPVLVLTNPGPVCSPTTVDLTVAAVTVGSTLPTGTVLTYWTDATATTALATPAAVATSGTYYIKAETAAGCSDIKPVTVTVNPVPVLTITNPAPVCSPASINLTTAAVTTGSTLPTGTVLTYWTDALATTPLATPAAVTTSGTYYIKAESAAGCIDIKPVVVIVNPTPVLVIHDPAPICKPNTIDLQLAAITLGSTLPSGTVLTYWTDLAATTPLATPNAVTNSGTYYIMAKTAEGCSDIKAVVVTINPTPVTSPIYHN